MTNDQLLTCAQLCVDSYAEKCPEGFRDYGDLRCGSHIIGDTAYVTYRGTNNLHNWLRNVSVWPSKSPCGYLTHAGVVMGLDRMLEPVRELMVTHRGLIVVEGHSLGGGFAKTSKEITGGPCVTFGSMRTNLRFCGQKFDDHYRFVNDDDPVDDLLKLTYHHPDPAIVFKDRDHELFDVKDHSMPLYRARLRQWVSRRG